MIAEQFAMFAGSSSTVAGMEKLGGSDLDDLNRTLYDIGAQDLLDVWDSMDTEVRKMQVTLQIRLLSFTVSWEVWAERLLSQHKRKIAFLKLLLRTKDCICCIQERSKT